MESKIEKRKMHCLGRFDEGRLLGAVHFVYPEHRFDRMLNEEWEML